MLKLRLALGLVLVLNLLAGCSSKTVTSGKVSGQVMYNGTPVPGGTIVFHSDAGTAGIPLSPEGRYETDVPLGNAVVTVETESVNPKGKKKQGYGGGKGSKIDQEYMAKMKGMKPMKESPLGEYRKIPAKYANKQTSPLKYTVEAGSHTFSPELKD